MCYFMTNLQKIHLCKNVLIVNTYSTLYQCVINIANGLFILDKTNCDHGINVKTILWQQQLQQSALK